MNMHEVQSFFFQAMRQGWALPGSEKANVPEMPGYKAIRYAEGPFMLLDLYCTVPNSTRSAGTTTIWHHRNPVWIMTYGGSYEANVIHCLKQALSVAYFSGAFVGGRGPALFRDGMEILYVNRVRKNDFTDFEGREEIFNLREGSVYGFHEYRGMALL